MFKVYVVGDAIKVRRRFSLPDVCKRELSKYAGVFQFPRVSCAAACADEAELDPGVAGKILFSITIHQYKSILSFVVCCANYSAYVDLGFVVLTD